MFSSGLFCSGVLGFSVCFLRASFSSVYAAVVWHHIWRELLCSGDGILPREHRFSHGRWNKSPFSGEQPWSHQAAWQGHSDFPPKAIFRCPNSQQGFCDWPQNHESSQKPSASQFHADDGKAPALGSSSQPCSGQGEDVSLPGCGVPGIPCSPGTMRPGAGRAATGPGGRRKSCPTIQPRAGGVRSAPAPKSDRLFLTLCYHTEVTLTCRASQTCSTLSVSLMNLTQSWKRDGEKVSRAGTQPPHPFP